MLEVTEAARERLKVLLDANTENPEDGIRLTVSGNGQLGITIDQEKPGDQVIEHEGSKVLLMDLFVSEGMSNFVLDNEEASGGKEFTLKEKTEEQ